jgi:hypothetical protein
MIQPAFTPFGWGFGTTADEQGNPLVILQFVDCTGTKIYFAALSDFEKFVEEAIKKKQEFSGGLVVAREMPK